MVLQELFKECCNTATSKGFHNPTELEGVLRERSIPEAICLMHSELSEALEAYRKDGLAAYTEVDGKPEGFISELADTLIRIGDTVEYLGLTDKFVAVLEQKLAFNKTRDFMHGKVM